MDIVRHLRDEGITVFLLHQYLEEADQLADRIVVIDHGTVIAEGTPDELKARIGGAVCISPSTMSTAHMRRPSWAPRWPVGENDGELTVPSDGPATLFAVVRILDENGIVPDDIGLRNPTLDDVFLALTGEPTDTDAEANA